MKTAFQQFETSSASQSLRDLTAQTERAHLLSDDACDGCLRWMRACREVLARDGETMARLRQEAKRSHNDASLAWGLAACGWLLLFAAAVRIVMF